MKWSRARAVAAALTATAVTGIAALGAASTADHADAAAFPATREASTWPFAWNSIWNMPRGDDARLVPAGIQPAAEMGMTVDEDILVLNPSAPKVDVVANDAGWDGSRTRCGSVQAGNVLYRGVPIPASFSTDPGYLGVTPNHSAALLSADGDTLIQTQPFHRCGTGGPATSQYQWGTDSLRGGDGIKGAHGGSGMSSIGGTIRLGEVVPGGELHHALKVNIDCSRLCSYAGGEPDGKSGFRWPAQAADSGAPGRYQGRVPALQMGSLLTLPADFDTESLATEPARIIARAMRDYGAYVVDDTGWQVYALATEWSPEGRVTDEFESAWGFGFETDQKASCGSSAAECQWAKDMGSVFSSLSVVDDNGPDAIGGAGARRQPCAPAFSDGTGGAPADCGPAPSSSSTTVTTTAPSTTAAPTTTEPPSTTAPTPTTTGRPPTTGTSAPAGTSTTAAPPTAPSTTVAPPTTQRPSTTQAPPTTHAPTNPPTTASPTTTPPTTTPPTTAAPPTTEAAPTTQPPTTQPPTTQPPTTEPPATTTPEAEPPGRSDLAWLFRLFIVLLQLLFGGFGR